MLQLQRQINNIWSSHLSLTQVLTLASVSFLITNLLVQPRFSIVLSRRSHSYIWENTILLRKGSNVLTSSQRNLSDELGEACSATTDCGDAQVIIIIIIIMTIRSAIIIIMTCQITTILTFPPGVLLRTQACEDQWLLSLDGSLQHGDEVALSELKIWSKWRKPPKRQGPNPSWTTTINKLLIFYHPIYHPTTTTQRNLTAFYSLQRHNSRILTKVKLEFLPVAARICDKFPRIAFKITMELYNELAFRWYKGSYSGSSCRSHIYHFFPRVKMFSSWFFNCFCSPSLIFANVAWFVFSLWKHLARLSLWDFGGKFWCFEGRQTGRQRQPGWRTVLSSI